MLSKTRESATEKSREIRETWRLCRTGKLRDDVIQTLCSLVFIDQLCDMGTSAV